MSIREAVGISSRDIRTRLGSIHDLAWRAAYRLGYPLARVWWWLLSPHHEGALIVVRLGSAVLLVRSSYRAEWNLPGGGLHRGETAEAAAKRELWEEVGLSITDLKPAGSRQGVWDGRRDHVHFFQVDLDSPPSIQVDNREIIEARWVSLAELESVVLTGPAAEQLELLRRELSRLPG